MRGDEALLLMSVVISGGAVLVGLLHLLWVLLPASLHCRFGQHRWGRIRSCAPKDGSTDVNAMMAWIEDDYDYYRLCARHGCGARKNVGPRYD